MLPAINLLQLWCTVTGESLSNVSCYGKHYCVLSASQLTEWVTEMRIKFMSQGQVIFEGGRDGNSEHFEGISETKSSDSNKLNNEHWFDFITVGAILGSYIVTPIKLPSRHVRSNTSMQH